MTTADTCDLWYGLHDSFIRRVETNADAATATVAVESVHLNEFYEYPDGSEFEIRFIGVQELSVLVSRKYGTAPDGNPLRRFESASWVQFENNFSDERGPVEEGRYGDTGRYEILQAHATRDDESITFVIEDLVDYAGFSAPDSDFLAELKFVASGAEVRCPDGATCTLHDFATLGEKYWRKRNA